MNEVIEALKAYIEKTEAREAEQQAQLAALVAQLAEKENQLVTLGQKVAELEARIETLEEEGIAAQPLATSDEEEEPEVEVELIMAEEDVPEIPETPETPEIPEIPAEPEPQAPEPEAEPAKPEPTPQPAKPEPAPEPEPQAPEPTPAAPAAAKFGTPVDDIRKAISLGDRFLFQRELFGQNGELMQKTLDAINGCKSFEEAVAYIDSKFGWDKESSTYQLFLTPIHRRFA